MTWNWDFTLDAAHRAALEAGKPLVYVCPPAGWAVRPLSAALPPAGALPATLVLVPETPAAVDLALALEVEPGLLPLHATTGIARTQSLLRRGRVRTLLATPSDTLELVRRAALQPERLARVVVAWPELMLASGGGEALDTVLADAARAGRVVLTSDEAAIADFLERHARRAPVAWAARLPEAPAGDVRCVICERARRGWAARAVLDALDPETAIVWDPYPEAHARLSDLAAEAGVRIAGPGSEPPEPAELAIALDLPSADLLAALGQAAPAVVVLIGAWQQPYLGRLAGRWKALRLDGPPDRARDQLFRRRQAIRDRLAAGVSPASLLALEPLFDEYDPALVAAALLADSGETAGAGGEPALVAWTRLHINAGRQDHVRPGDIVGVLLNEAGLAKDDVGRIEIRERFSLVDVRAELAERALRGLAGVTIRGRRIAARPDRR